MRSLLLMPAVLTAGLAVTVAAGSAVTATGPARCLVLAASGACWLRAGLASRLGCRDS